jgi:hypothetical protein
MRGKPKQIIGDIRIFHDVVADESLQGGMPKNRKVKRPPENG